MLAEGKDVSTICNTPMPLRAIYRRCRGPRRGRSQPSRGFEFPAVRGKRDWIALPEEAPKLVAALPEEDRALWATALYGGLRVSEPWALRDADIDPRGWRAVLLAHLAARKLRRGSGEQRAFFGGRLKPFNRGHVVARALKAWKKAGITPIMLHEARHTFASILIAASVKGKLSRRTSGTARSRSRSTATGT